MTAEAGEVAADNLAAALAGRKPSAAYEHEMLLVVDAGSRDSILLRKGLWDESDEGASRVLFRGRAERAHERYRRAKNS